MIKVIDVDLSLFVGSVNLMSILKTI